MVDVESDEPILGDYSMITPTLGQTFGLRRATLNQPDGIQAQTGF